MPPAPTPPAAPKPPPRRRRFSFLRFFLLLIFALGAFASALLVWGYHEFERDLPDRFASLIDYRPSKASRVFSADGELIGEFFLEKRIVIPYERMPSHVRLAFVAAEDNRFFDHTGVDPIGILRAAFANVKAGRVVQGGSTITQQVAKLLLVGGERKLARKIREAILAHKIEVRLTKEQILALYLNHVYLGHGAWGVQAAAEIYFGKDAEQLTIAEAAMLAGLPKAPTDDSPFTAYDRARARQQYVLDQLIENGFVSAEDGARARTEPIAIISRDAPLNHVAAPYFVEYVRRWAQDRWGGKRLYDTGLFIHTTLDMRQQRAAESAVRHGLEDLDKRLGFRGPIGHLDEADRETFITTGPLPYIGDRDSGRTAPTAGAVLAGKPYVAMIESIEPGSREKGKPPTITVRIGPERLFLAEEDAGRVDRWAGRKDPTSKIGPGDLIPVKLVRLDVKVTKNRKKFVEQQRFAALAQRPDVQAAVVAVDPHTGFLTAMVGGYDYDLSQFNRAVQARRQAGSSIKPFIYTAAIEKGYHELTLVPDAPVAIHTAAGIWAPQNYKNEFLGPVTLRTALAKSLNTVAVRLVEDVGIDNTIETFRRFGLTSPIVRHPSIALGVPELSPMEAAYAQATFPALGLEVAPVFITRVVDADGTVLQQHEIPPAEARRRRIAADTAYVMVDLMKNAVENGTGKKALALGRPTAGKTGTSNDFKDAWFVGYTADLLAVAWVGRDDFKSIAYDATGGQVALPIWLEFMQNGHPKTPVRDFEAPPGILFVRATEKGSPARAGTPGAILVPFTRGTLPREFAIETTAGFTDESF